MEIEATVKYGNGHAFFEIYCDSPGLYHANLIHFDGEKKLSPPKKITMVRGIRQWTGSFEDVDLLNQLGKAIEESYPKSPDISIFK